jgi:hypothetical protein
MKGVIGMIELEQAGQRLQEVQETLTKIGDSL